MLTENSNLQSDAVSNFTEIGLPSNLLANREVGLQLSGDVLGETVNYAVGVFNGTADLASSTNQDTDNNSDKDLAGRIFAQPFKNNGPQSLKGLGVGVAGSFGHKEGSTTPTYKSTGQANIFSYSSTNADGPHVRITPQAYFYKGSLGLLGEYAVSKQKVNRVSSGTIIRDTFSNKGWQLSGNYVLTGELASYKGITPRINFDPSQGTWGALEAVGRYGHLDIDDSIFDNGFSSLNTSVSAADAWGLGLNWYPHKNYRVSLDFEQTRFTGGAPAGGDRQTENVILSRFQVSY
jgi:phosphate-selective porin OprO/OprP